MSKSFLRTKVEAIEEPSVNLTPLIDVVFVILIGFIIIAPMLEMDNVELAEAPSVKGGNITSFQEASPLAIHVKQDNTVWIQGKKVSPLELSQFLLEAKKLYPKATPQLFHDRKGHFGTYQMVKNAAEAAGFDKMDVVLKP